MGKPTGIIYGTKALFGWSSAYPNARLLVAGVLMLGPLPYLLGMWLYYVAQYQTSISKSGGETDLISYAFVAGLLFIVIVHLAGALIFGIAIGRIVNSHKRKAPVNPLASTPGATPESG